MTTSWSYDSRGRVTQETKVIPGSGTFSTSYTYDDLDRVVTLTYPDGEVVTQRYNRQGLVKALLGTNAMTMTAVQYNALGQTTYMTLGNGLRAYYAYDGRTGALQHQWTTSSLLDLRYAYDGVGNVARIQDGLGKTLTFTDTFSTKNTTAWTWNASYQTVPYTYSNGLVVKKDRKSVV